MFSSAFHVSLLLFINCDPRMDTHTHTIKGQALDSPIKSADRATTSPISTLDTADQETAVPGNGVPKVVESSSEVHEELHCNKTSSLNNLPMDITDSTTVGVSISCSDVQVLSTSAPSSSGGTEVVDLSSTGTQVNRTGQRSPSPAPALPPPVQSTSSALSDNVFETQSDAEGEAKSKADDDVFSTEKKKAEAPSSNGGGGIEDLNPTFAKLMAEQRRKSEELKLKGQ